MPNISARKYYYKVQEYKDKLKQSQKCENCGEDNYILLDFAHYDRNNKSIGLARAKTIAQIDKELEKGRFLCVWCHRLETKEENKQIRLSKIENYTFPLVLDDLAKVCHGPICNGQVRHSSLFYKNKALCPTKQCKQCLNLKRQKLVKKKQDFVNSKKLKIASCQICGVIVKEDTFCCFDFDHTNRDTKINGIATMVQRNRTLTLIEEEIEKCRLLCCKCHRLHTWEQFSYTFNDKPKSKKCSNCPNYIHRCASQCKYCDLKYREKVYNKHKQKVKPNPEHKQKVKPNPEHKQKVKTKFCMDCNCEISRQATKCRECYYKSIRNPLRPLKSLLLSEIKDEGYKNVCRKYGVTQSTIRRWADLSK